MPNEAKAANAEDWAIRLARHAGWNGAAPWQGVPNLGHPDLNVWGFVGGLLGGAFFGAIAGTLLYIYLPRILNRIDRQP